ncbi:MAG: GNAT family N-acetyltransferase [candidate division Zixibacteria bacterium]|nr:GNAT family N-acetyltransferase [candidate division Zixibacteria bacterium]
MHVRLAVPEDTDCLLELMKGLARYEDYIDQFAVTRESILEHGFGDERLFTAFVAEHDDELVGMAVTYPIHWTYTLRPKLVLKELFVVEGARSMGVGKSLMASVTTHARAMDASEVIWTVMSGNADAEAFYRSLGGLPDRKWNNWTLNLDT